MTKRKKITISISAILFLIALIGVSIICVLGTRNIQHMDVKYKDLQRLMGEECPVPKGMDDSWIDAEINFPIGTDYAKSFYPRDVEDKLRTVGSDSIRDIASYMPNLFGSVPSLCDNFDIMCIGENEKSNGYSLFVSRIEGERKYQLEGRKHTTAKGALIGDQVTEFLFEEDARAIAGTSITYSVYEYVSISGEIEKTIYVGFRMKSSIYYIATKAIDAQSEQIAQDIKWIIESMK